MKKGEKKRRRIKKKRGLEEKRGNMRREQRDERR